jgi:allantoicase
MMKQCKGMNARGELCQAPMVGSDGWCNTHRPGNEGLISELGKRGAAQTNLVHITHAEGNAASKAVAEWCKAESAAVTKSLVNELHKALESDAKKQMWLCCRQAGEEYDGCVVGIP